MSDPRPISIALVGIGGYGNHYVSSLLDTASRNDFKFVGAIDPSPASCRRLIDLHARGVPLFPSLDACYVAVRPDLVVISSPLQHHAQQSCFALRNGSHVLCEKPLCATPEQARLMAGERDRTGRLVAVGYQWSFSAAIQQLKDDVLSGVLGQPLRLRTTVLWPRDGAYYARNKWAGAKRDAAGNWVLDSPVNNACAHFLHNMLYVLGPQTDLSAEPARVTAELYRANPIENYDTAALRCITRDGVELLFIVSHATATSRGPIFSYEFENATVEFDDVANGEIRAKFKDGTVKSYGSPERPRDEKLWKAVDAIHADEPTVCGIEAAAAHTKCVWAAQQSSVDASAFPSSLLRADASGRFGSRRVWVDGLEDELAQCFDQWALPSELSLKWASASCEVAVDVDIPPRPSIARV